MKQIRHQLLSTLPISGKLLVSSLATVALLNAYLDGSLLAAEKPAASANQLLFEDQIQPLLTSRCGECHNRKSSKGELDLTTSEGLQAGGESGPLLVPGKPSDSLLIEKIVDGEMPPKGKNPLTKQEIKLLKHWVQTGGHSGTAKKSQAISQWSVLPILQLRCTVCHGTRKQEGGLDLRSRAAMLKGGKSGPAIVPGKPAESLLLKRIHDGEMPPHRELVNYSVKPMETGEIALLSKWIEQGAKADQLPTNVVRGNKDPLVSDEDRQFWSFQPPRRPVVPMVKSPVPLHGSVDHFTTAALEKKGLNLSPASDPLVLLRRAYYDLLGLPPSPAQVTEFLNDQAPGAYERLLDRLLASPQYGERWGGFWLDLAGYADSEGIQHSDSIRPFAYRYRDYVIRSWNADKSYARFLMEQVAGDELANYSDPDSVSSQVHDNLVATGFLRMVPDATYFGITNFVPDRLEIIDDTLEVFSSSVMGLTVKCARCHSHKFDPIPQRDYYRLAAIFKGAIDENDWLKPTRQSGDPGSRDRYLAAISTAERDTWRQHQQSIKEAVAVIEKRISEEEKRLVRLEQEERIKKLPAAIQADIERMLATPADKRDAVQKYLADKFAEPLKVTQDNLLKTNQGFKKYYDTAQAEIKKTKEQEKPQPLIRALWDRGEPSPTYILRRGNYLTPGRLVEPGLPAVLTHGDTAIVNRLSTDQAPGTGRRLALARWLTQPEHPLTSRVIANRIWKHHFQHGIVTTLDNFGRAGARPTHPELLDWLATELIDSGWSIKHLHRVIMTSATYRQQSKVTQAHLKADPDNIWLSRMPLKRLDAEMLRDALLSVSDRLRLTPFGPADPVEARSDGLVISMPTQGSWRRSVYVIQRRTQPLTILGTFDRPQMNPNCVERMNSTVAPQALHLLNNKMIHELSVAFAGRIKNEAGNDRQAQIKQAYLVALSRSPSKAELDLSLSYLDKLTLQWKQEQPQKTAEAPQRALENFCHAVINLAAFIYID